MVAIDVDIVVVGGGIVGLATAHALTKRLSGASIVVIDKEQQVASHQTGHNSGVLHSGIYYRPGSLKSQLTIAGGNQMIAFCSERGINHDRCGKMVVATTETEQAQLDKLTRLAIANGVEARTLSSGEATEMEPYVRSKAALHVPSAGRVDFASVAKVLANELLLAGGAVRTQVEALRGSPTASGWRIDTSDGPLSTRFLVGCAGLHSDRLARRTGSNPALAILPFRGEYLEIANPSANLVRGLVYPVPDARFPFLGVHLTRSLDNRVLAGPNAVLALAREGYRRCDFSFRDTLSIAIWPGTHRLLARHWRPGLSELARSMSRRRFIFAARRLVPDLAPQDLSRSKTGVRAQAVDRNGSLVDDFALVEGPQSLHVVNAPSPAATASLSIGDLVARRVAKSLAN